MIGSAFTPKLCQPSAINSKLPKCRTKIRPSNPVQPRRSGNRSGTARAQKNKSKLPANVFADAHSQRMAEGRGGGSLLRNAAASIPGHAKRYAQDRQAAWATSPRARHQESHFNPKKIAAARAHIKPQAGNRAAAKSRLRRAVLAARAGSDRDALYSFRAFVTRFGFR